VKLQVVVANGCSDDTAARAHTPGFTARGWALEVLAQATRSPFLPMPPSALRCAQAGAVSPAGYAGAD